MDSRSFENRLLEYYSSLGFFVDKSEFVRTRKKTIETFKRTESINREIQIEDVFQEISFKLGIHPNSEIMNHIYSLYLNSSTVKLCADTEKILRHLKEKYTLGVISNTISNLPRIAVETVDLDDCFSTLVLSRDLRIRKPDPEVFWFALKNLGIENYEAIHVGDSLGQDINGCKRTGIPTVWIRNNKKKSSEKPDYIIDSLLELTEIL